MYMPTEVEIGLAWLFSEYSTEVPNSPSHFVFLLNEQQKSMLNTSDASNKQPADILSSSTEFNGEEKEQVATWNSLYAEVAARMGADGKQIAKATLLTEVIERLSISESALEKLKESTLQEKRNRIDSQASLKSELQDLIHKISTFSKTLGGTGEVDIFTGVQTLHDGVLDTHDQKLTFLGDSLRSIRSELAGLSQSLEQAMEEVRAAAAEARAVQTDLDHRLQMNMVRKSQRSQIGISIALALPVARKLPELCPPFSTMLRGSHTHTPLPGPTINKGRSLHFVKSAKPTRAG